MKKINRVLLTLAILSILLTASRCNRTPDGEEFIVQPTMPVEEEIIETEAAQLPTAEPTPESFDWLDSVTIDEFTEAIDQEMMNMVEEEKQAILDTLAGMTAEELNQAIAQVMDKLNDGEKLKFIAWLKEHYLIYQNASVDKWQLPASFLKPESFDWPAGIPEPNQATLYRVTTGGEVTQIVLVNVTQTTYQDWAASLSEEWAESQGITQFIGETKAKNVEYVDLNTGYNFGPDTKTILDLFTEAGRAGEGLPFTIVFGDEHMSKWLELAYSMNMAILTFNGNFSGESAGQN
jgi:hypothetical protein